jgi:hypothetical protein
MVSPLQDEDPFAVPIDWQPEIPTFEKVSDDNNCPCPDDYQQVNIWVLRITEITNITLINRNNLLITK